MTQTDLVIHFSVLRQSTSTSIWPPDWSQWIPDLLTAVAFGFVVGYAVMRAEKRVDARRARERTGRAQLDAVESIVGTLDEPFEYSGGSSLPQDKELKRVRSVTRDVPREEAEVIHPGFYFLRAIDDAWEQVIRTGEALDERLSTYPVQYPGQLNQIREAIVASADNRPGFIDFSKIQDVPRRAAEGDPSLQQLAERYRAARKILEGTRQAFNEVDGQWRADSWTISLYMTKDAPLPLFPRIWRSMVAKRRRQQALESARQVGMNRMFATGEPWFGPRGW
ncbi:hypothetical protein JNB63_11850 [Microbacterium trichothecenolyticum]|uniref:hypothetical protein n=1 Tax=Microbacterium trichothecenolyticum TaxID=69370 RepID=UPI001C6E4DA9|nr:hypothetical protein [Microbacterium trichothecenolyticum]MBW9120788.1 hypothetical protein [Microbacterium trichothecenolyticum]